MWYALRTGLRAPPKPETQLLDRSSRTPAFRTAATAFCRATHQRPRTSADEGSTHTIRLLADAPARAVGAAAAGGDTCVLADLRTSRTAIADHAPAVCGICGRRIRGRAAIVDGGWRIALRAGIPILPGCFAGAVWWRVRKRACAAARAATGYEERPHNVGATQSENGSRHGLITKLGHEAEFTSMAQRLGRPAWLVRRSSSGNRHRRRTGERSLGPARSCRDAELRPGECNLPGHWRNPCSPRRA